MQRKAVAGRASFEESNCSKVMLQDAMILEENPLDNDMCNQISLNFFVKRMA